MRAYDGDILAFADDLCLAERDAVVRIVVDFALNDVKLLVLNKDNGVIVADRRAQQAGWRRPP